MNFHNQNPLLSNRGALCRRETVCLPTAPKTPHAANIDAMHPALLNSLSRSNAMGQWVGPYHSPSSFSVGLGGGNILTDISNKFKNQAMLTQLLLIGGLVIGGVVIYKRYQK